MIFALRSLLLLDIGPGAIPAIQLAWAGTSWPWDKDLWKSLRDGHDFPP